jgi:hypothetical protein
MIPAPCPSLIRKPNFQYIERHNLGWVCLYDCNTMMILLMTCSGMDTLSSKHNLGYESNLLTEVFLNDSIEVMIQDSLKLFITVIGLIKTFEFCTFTFKSLEKRLYLM